MRISLFCFIVYKLSMSLMNTYIFTNEIYCHSIYGRFRKCTFGNRLLAKSHDAMQCNGA